MQHPSLFFKNGTMSDLQPSSLMFRITNLMLQNFRNFSTYSLQVNDGPVILTAPNGSGKTNILEALSLLSPGRGLRGVPLDMMQYQGANRINAPWQVGVRFLENGEVRSLGTFSHPSYHAERRGVRYEGEPLKNQSQLTHYLNVLWFTPSMGGLLSGPGQDQRQFVDRLVYARDAHHATLRQSYEKLLKERGALLKDAKAKGGHLSFEQNAWCTVLEEKMAPLAIAMARNRAHLLHELSRAPFHTDVFPAFDAHMTGDLEERILEYDDEDAVIWLQEKLLTRRKEDMYRGSASVGAHKSKLRVLHKKKQILAEFCSFGEQKMLVLAIILAFVKQPLNHGLVLLLDDVADHLDAHHRAVLWREVQSLSKGGGHHVWLSGANPSLFKGLEGQYVTHLEKS